MESEIAMHTAAVIGDVVGLASGQPAYRILIVEDQLENQLLLSQLTESIIGFIDEIKNQCSLKGIKGWADLSPRKSNLVAWWLG
jgi:hypothetical protein